MASDNLQECEVHSNDEAFAQGIRENFYIEKLGKRDVVVKCINKHETDENMTRNLTEEKLQELHHQNIIQIFSYEVIGNHFHIKTERCNSDLMIEVHVSGYLISVSFSIRFGLF